MPRSATYHDCALSDSTTVHYIKAGDPSKPTILLLHGFPSDTSQFRNLIPLLAQRYHILAPDLPGFGLTKVPSDYIYTFDNLTATIRAWIDKIGLKKFIVYIFDYGSPVAFRIATAHPGMITAIVTQNGNAYKDGFGEPFWQPIFNLWDTSDSEDARKVLRDNVLTLGTTAYQYTAGVPEADLPLIDPMTYNTDYHMNVSPESGRQEAQLDLFYDYRNNVQLYPKWQDYMRDSKVPVLAVWGKGDPAFVPPGAEAFRRDAVDARVELLDAGHFALETKVNEVARIMLEWLAELKL